METWSSWADLRVRSELVAFFVGSLDEVWEFVYVAVAAVGAVEEEGCVGAVGGERVED